jgi:hypothetical protein
MACGIIVEADNTKLAPDGEELPWGMPGWRRLAAIIRSAWALELNRYKAAVIILVAGVAPEKEALDTGIERRG